MGITCKPLGQLKKELKKIENQKLKEKAALNKASSKKHK